MRKQRTRQRPRRHVNRLLLYGAILTLILILAVSTVGRQEFGASHKFSLEVVGSLQAALARVTGFGRELWQDYTALVNVREENERLRAELAQARELNNTFREAAATNEGLRRLLQFKESLPLPTLTARIVGKDPGLWFRTVIVDRGSGDGVRKGMPVATDQGIVGQVLDTSPNYAKILFATDPNSAFDVIVQRTRTPGILAGQGSDRYRLNYVMKNADVVKGDRVVTSELGGIFPQGLLVGTVVLVHQEPRGMFQEIEVTPAIDFTRLENVIIIMKEPLQTQSP